MSAEPAHLPVDGPAAPPRDNGELVFAAPWESRAFGLAFALSDQGLFTWEEFQQALITAIRSWEQHHAPGECWSYYRCWLQALESLVAERKVVTVAEVDARSAELAHRTPGHDH